MNELKKFDTTEELKAAAEKEFEATADEEIHGWGSLSRKISGTECDISNHGRVRWRGVVKENNDE